MAECQVVALVLSCELFWKPSCTNFMKPKSVMDDSVSGTMTDAQMMCHFIDSHPLINQNHGMESSVFLCSGCGQVSWSFFIVDTYATAFNMVINLYTLLCGKELFPYRTNSLQWVSGCVTPSAHKNCITAHCRSVMHMESGVAMLSLLQQHYNWLIKVENVSQSYR
jgi:hypothetical protein